MFGDVDSNTRGYPTFKIGTQFSLGAGGTPSTQNKEYWDNGTISWIGSNMCQNAVLYENDGKYITEKGYANSSAKLFKRDTVLVALVGATIGKVALLKFETTTNQNVLGIWDIKENGYNPYYVYYYMQAIYGKFTAIGDGNFKMASKAFVSDLDILKPSLEKQDEFASFVEQADKLWFIEMFGDSILNDKNWPTSAMSDCCQMKGTKSIPHKEKYWLLNLDKIKSETGEILGKDYVVRDEVGSSTFFFDKNYVLYSKLRPYLNKVIISDESGFATSELVPLKPDACLNSYYLAFLLRSKSFVNWIDSTSSGAKMPRASMSALRSFRVPLPPLELQNRFADFVHLVDKSRFVVHSRYFLWLNFTFVSSTIAYSRVVSILECPKRC